MEINPADFVSFYEWLGPALLFFLQAVPIAILIGILVGYLIAAVRNGPIEGLFVVARVIATAVTQDLPKTSLRRVGAMARLAFQEAIRRRVLVVFAIFAVLFLFAGWFLDVKSDQPARLYMSFVLTATKFLVLFLALFLSVFSLPADIKNRTIYTVVTKPVRANEVVLGRILGFTTVGTLILLVMLAVSYVFVVRGLRHQHEVIDPLEPVTAVVDGQERTEYVGETTFNANHTHRFRLGPDGTGVTEQVMGHWHAVSRGEGDTVEVGPPEGALLARVPKFGTLRFIDRSGNPASSGTNVGKEWEYRSYIEGGTLQAAIWTFEGVEAEDFPDDEVPIALNLSVFRTYKGDIVTPVRGILFITHPDPAKNLRCEPISFISQEFQEQVIRIPRKLKRDRLTGTSSEELDLFDDLLEDGKMELWLRCDDRSQYFGVAQADVYIRTHDAPFSLNFAKAYVGIWLQMVIVVSVGVMFSTFLSSPVALLATVIVFMLGFFKMFIQKMWSGEVFGGGPVEAAIRTVNQENLVSELDLHPVVMQAVRWSDFVLLTGMNVVSAALPSFSSLGRLTEFVAYNYNVAGGLLARQCTITFAYVVAFSFISYFLLKTREIAA